MEVNWKQIERDLEALGVAEKVWKDCMANGSYAERGEQKSREDCLEELVQKEVITRYQAKRVAEGRGGDLVISDYVILDEIGAGGMGKVCRARHRKLMRLVAIKWLHDQYKDHPDGLRRFLNEIRLLAGLDHPNIARAYDAGTHHDLPYLVMEFVTGENLHAILRRRGPFPPNAAFECVLQAAQGLGYAHQQGIIHRDVKPSNLVVTRQGQIKLLDMGLAKVLNNPQASAALTHTDQVLGTVDFMSPEQAFHTHPVDHRTDIYSLGCTFYMLLTGEPPYHGQTPAATLLAHMTAPIPQLRGKSEMALQPLQKVLSRMMAKTPDERYASMDQAVAALEAIRQPLSQGVELLTASSASPHHAADTLNWNPVGNLSQLLQTPPLSIAPAFHTQKNQADPTTPNQSPVASHPLQNSDVSSPDEPTSDTVSLPITTPHLKNVLIAATLLLCSLLGFAWMFSGGDVPIEEPRPVLVPVENDIPIAKPELHPSINPVDKDIPELIAALRVPSPAVASEASVRLKNRGAAAVPALLELLREDNPKLRLRAIVVLNNMEQHELSKEGKQAIPVLVHTLGDSDINIAVVASQLLARLGTPAVDSLAQAAESSVAQVQRLSIETLASLGSAALPALPNLAKALRDPSTRENAGKALACLGKPAVPKLTAALSDPSVDVRITAATALGQIGPDAQESTATLIGALDYTDKNLDRAVVDALGKIGASAIPQLIAALQVEPSKEQVLKNIALALAAIGESSVEPLIPVLKSPNSNTRRHAATALEKIGPAATAALPALEEALKAEKDSSVSFYLRSAQLKINR